MKTWKKTVIAASVFLTTAMPIATAEKALYKVLKYNGNTEAVIQLDNGKIYSLIGSGECGFTFNSPTKTPTPTPIFAVTAIPEKTEEKEKEMLGNPGNAKPVGKSGEKGPEFNPPPDGPGIRGKSDNPNKK